MADRTVEIAIKTTTDTAAAEAQVEALEAVAAAAEEVTAAAEAAAEATAAAAEAQEEAAKSEDKATKKKEEGAEASKKNAKAQDEVKKSTFNAGYAMQTFGQIMNDAPYGISAVSGQVGQLVGALGMGMGLAGILTLAATALDQMLKHVDLFGSAAAKAAADAKKLAEEADVTARKAREVAEAEAEAEAATGRHAKEMQGLTDEYEAQIQAIDRAAAARVREAAAVAELADAIKEKRMAEIAVAESTGEMTGPQADDARGMLDAEAAAAAEKRRQEATQAEIADAAARANAAAAARVAAQSRLRDLGSRDASGLMSDAQRKAEEARLESAKRDAEEAEKRKEELDGAMLQAWTFVKDFAPNALYDMSGGLIGDDSAAATGEQNRAKAKAEADRLAALERARESARKIAADNAARGRMGGRSGDAVEEMTGQLEEAERKAAEDERRATERMEELRREDAVRRQIYEARQGAASRMGEARRYRTQSAERSAAEADMERQRQEEEKATLHALKTATARRGPDEGMAAVLALVQTLVQRTGAMDADTRKALMALRAKVEQIGQGR